MLRRKLVVLSAAVLAGALAACASTSDSNSSTDAGNPRGDSSSGVTAFGACGGKIVDPVTGTIDASEYKRQARLWDRDTIDCRLGPKFADLHPGSPVDARPTAYEPVHKPNPGGFLCKTYELSGTCSGTCDYGSTSGQVLYAPDAPGGTGVDRIQSYGYEKGVICESPQTGAYLGGPHPDPGLTTWTTKLGRPVLLPNGFSQTEMHETNAGITIFPDGLVGATGNQTAGDTKPYFQLPANKVPTAVAVSTYNEFAFVTLWDTDAIKGQIAVFALRADKPQAFSVHYFALPNEGGFSAIHLMGYIDLPDMVAPTAVAVSGDNGSTPGGHVIGFEFGNTGDPTKNIITSATARSAFARADYERWVPLTGQLVVASRWEGKLSFIDLKPLAAFVRDVYFGADDVKRQSAAAQDVWPFTFASNPEATPLVAATLTSPHPTVLRVGNMPNSNGKGMAKQLKAVVGNLDGEVRAYDLSGFVSTAPRPIPAAGIVEMGKVLAGRNLTSMTLRANSADQVLTTSRGDRSIQWIGVDDKDGVFKLLRTFQDTRLNDPVITDASDRGPVVTTGDFTAKKLLTFRIGPTENNASKPPANYGCGAAGADATCASGEFGGELGLLGSPFYLGTTNVN